MTSYTYDDNGNELSAGLRTFSYDVANRLKTTTLGTTTTTYTYSGDGVRLQASTGAAASAKMNFLWDVSHELPQVALERNGNNVLQRRYTYGIRRLRQANGTASYYACDSLGSVAELLSNSGGAQRSWTYEPFGSVYSSSGSSPANFLQFTGEYLDPTGLYHLRARQYDPANGRFNTVDPDEPSSVAGVSSYAYVDNMPLVLVDPSGAVFRPPTIGQEAASGATSAYKPAMVNASDCVVFSSGATKRYKRHSMFFPPLYALPFAFWIGFSGSDAVKCGAARHSLVVDFNWDTRSLARANAVVWGRFWAEDSLGRETSIYEDLVIGSGTDRGNPLAGQHNLSVSTGTYRTFTKLVLGFGVLQKTGGGEIDDDVISLDSREALIRV